MSDLTREQHLERLRSLPPEVLESIAVVCESAETSVDYVVGEDGGSMPVDDIHETLYALGKEIRRLRGTPTVIGPKESRYYGAILVISSRPSLDDFDDWMDAEGTPRQYVAPSFMSPGRPVVEVWASDVADALQYHENRARRRMAYSRDGYRAEVVYRLLMAGF